MMPSDCHTGEDLSGHAGPGDTGRVELVDNDTARSHVAGVASAGAPEHLTKEQSVQKSDDIEHCGESPCATTDCSVKSQHSVCGVNGQGLHNPLCKNLHDAGGCTDFVQPCSKVVTPCLKKKKHSAGNCDIHPSSSGTSASKDFSRIPKLASRFKEQKGADASDSARLLSSSVSTSCDQGAGVSHHLPPSSQAFCTDENQNIASERSIKENTSAKGREKCRPLGSEKDKCSTSPSFEDESNSLLTQSGGDTGSQGQPGGEPGEACGLYDSANLPISLTGSHLTGLSSCVGQMTGLSQSCCVPEPASSSTVESLPFELVQSDIVVKPQPRGCCDSHRLIASASQSDGGLGASSATVTAELYGQAESCCSLDRGQGSLRDIDSLPASEINLPQLGTAEARSCGPAKPVQASSETVSSEELESKSRSSENVVNELSQHHQGGSCSETRCDTGDGESPQSCVCLEDIPEELLLKIFSFFTPAELCRHVSRVCRRWHCLAYDVSLWHRLDLSSLRATGPQLRQIVNRIPGAVRYLDISGLAGLSVADVGDVAAFCPELTHLDTGFVDELTGPMLQLMLMFCPKIQFLNLEGCKEANNEMMWVLAQNAGPQLKQLNFSHCFMTDEGLTMMTKHLTGLTHINIDGISWISDGVVRLLATTYMDSLECLELDGNYLTDATLISISLCHHLQTLSISFCDDLTDQSVRCLLRLKKLEKLVLKKGPGLSASLLVELFSSPVLQNLRYLDLTECQQLTDEGVHTIAQTCADSLTTLNLSWCWNVTDKGMDTVAQRCRNMIRLYLTGLHRLEGAWLIVAVETMKNLIYISCEQCNEVNDSLIEEAVRNKPDLVILNYYGEVFMHNNLQRIVCDEESAMKNVQGTVCKEQSTVQS